MSSSQNTFEIHSDTLTCQSPSDKLIRFLSDIHHLESILPKDKIHNINSPDKNTIRFDIENIISLTLHIDQSNPNTIIYRSEPFGNYFLVLIVHFNDQYQSQITLTGHLNPFVLSIAKNKLTHLVNKINKELSELKLT
jgi:hypothetical protein